MFRSLYPQDDLSVGRRLIRKDDGPLFCAAQIDLKIEDRFGKSVKPRDWFFVPLPVIDKAVKRIHDGSIINFVYDPKTVQLVEKK